MSKTRTITNFDTLFRNKMDSPLNSFISEANEWSLKLQELHKKACQDLPDVLKGLMERGWYFDSGMPNSWVYKLKRDLKVEDNIELIEKLFEEYFDQEIDNIKDNIISKYTNRKHILKDAFEAHEQGKYNLSIPVFIIQADGIFKELCHKNLFVSKQNAINKYLNENDIVGWDKIFFTSLNKRSPLDAHVEEETEIPNRHYILHGNALEYGTKINSLKGISLLNYLAKLGQTVE